jgi:hypothetical protein
VCHDSCTVECEYSPVHGMSRLPLKLHIETERERE